MHEAIDNELLVAQQQNNKNGDMYGLSNEGEKQKGDFHSRRGGRPSNSGKSLSWGNWNLSEMNKILEGRDNLKAHISKHCL